MISLVLGLGNLGREYEQTRHNVGFDVIEAVARRNPGIVFGQFDRYDLAEKKLKERTLWLARPRTYMNRSGWAAQELLNRLQLPPQELLVVLDDLNLPLGILRIRPEGSDGGHNGLKSVIESIDCETVPRMRLGIGNPQVGIDAVDFVLSRFGIDEREQIDSVIEQAADAIFEANEHPLDGVMTKYNNNPAPPDDTRPGGAV